MRRPQITTRIAILAPMKSELKPLVRLLKLKPARTGIRSLLKCRLGTAEIVATTTGIGTLAASRMTEMLLDAGRIDHLIVVGIAGGLGPSVEIGDLVVPSAVIDLPTHLEYRPSTLGSAVPRGKLVTTDAVPIDPHEAARLARQGVIAVDMETSAIAAACERRQCPWSVFRAISDRADDGSTDAALFGLAGPDGSPDLPAVLRFVLTNPKRVPQLARLARGAGLAANVAASAAFRALQEIHSP